MGVAKPLILYHMKSIDQVRCFASIPPIDNCRQVIIGPPPSYSNNMMYGYENCKIKDIVMCNTRLWLNKLIGMLEPSVYVTTTYGKLWGKGGLPIPEKSGRVFIHHGLSNSASIKIFKQHRASPINVRAFDLLCGQGEGFKNLLTHEHIGIDENKIVLNALPQLDLLFNQNFDEHKDKILTGITNVNNRKVILYAGYGAHDGPDYEGHNKEYFDTLFEIQRIAKKYNFIVLFKSRRLIQNVIGYFKKKKHILGPDTTEEYLSRFEDVINDDNVILFNKQFPIHYLFFADVVILNGYSTIEVEASLAKRPLINVNLVKDSMINGTFGSAQSGAAVDVIDISDLEQAIINTTENESFIKTITEKQKMYTKNLGINFDGNAGQRVADAIAKLI